MSLVLGIDVSTTATKAVLIDESGDIAAIGTAEYGYDVPRPGWSEQDPGLWWDGAVAATRAALRAARADGSRVSAIGLTGQMHGAVLLDDADQVLRPAILWNDQRTARECQLIRDTIGAERLVHITGNDALTGFTAPKLVWVRDNEPDIWARTRHVLLPKDYLRLRLTGDARHGQGRRLGHDPVRPRRARLVGRGSRRAPDWSRADAAHVRGPFHHRHGDC